MCARTALRGHPSHALAALAPSAFSLRLDFAQKQMRKIKEKKQLTLLGKLPARKERWARSRARRTEPRRSLRLLLLHVLVTEDDGVLYYVMNIFVLLFV